MEFDGRAQLPVVRNGKEKICVPKLCACIGPERNENGWNGVNGVRDACKWSKRMGLNAGWLGWPWLWVLWWCCRCCCRVRSSWRHDTHLQTIKYNSDMDFVCGTRDAMTTRFYPPAGGYQFQFSQKFNNTAYKNGWFDCWLFDASHYVRIHTHHVLFVIISMCCCCLVAELYMKIR